MACSSAVCFVASASASVACCRSWTPTCSAKRREAARVSSLTRMTPFLTARPFFAAAGTPESVGAMGLFSQRTYDFRAISQPAALPATLGRT